MILARFDRRDEIRMALPMKKVKGLSVVCRKQWWREQVKSCDVHRLAVSFWSCATFFGRGIAVITFGITLLDLAHRLDTNVAVLSAMFLVRAVGSVVGIAGVGALSDRFKWLSFTLLSLSLAGALTTTAIIPLSVHVAMLGAVMFLNGVAYGAMLNGVHTVLFKMWGDKSGPSMQCLHAAYAVGAFMSPLVAKPFLQDVPDLVESGDRTFFNVSCNLVAGTFLCDDYESSGCDLLPLCLNTSMAEACSGTNTSNSSSFYIQYDVNNVSNCTVVSSTETQITLLFGWAYWISAMVLLPSALAFMYFAVRYDFKKCVKGKCSSSDHSQVLQTLDNPDGTAHEAEQLLKEDEQELTKSESMASDVEQTSDEQEKAVSLSTDVEESEEDIDTVPSSKEFVEKSSGKPTIVKTYKYPALILLFFFMIFYVGTELTYGRLILTYAVKSDLHFSKQKAAILAALFFGLFAFARFISIILALLKIRASVMISLNLTGTLLSVTLFIMLPHNDTAVWIASAGLGASFAAIFPTVMAWLSEHLTVSGKAMGVVLAGANLGDILIPSLAGVLIGKVNPDTFVYFNFTTIVTSVTLMAILFFITFIYQRRHLPDVKGVQYKKLEEAVDLCTYPNANSSAEVKPSE